MMDDARKLLTDLLYEAGVERGYVGGERFREHVADYILESPIFNAIVAEKVNEVAETVPLVEKINKLSKTYVPLYTDEISNILHASANVLIGEEEGK